MKIIIGFMLLTLIGCADTGLKPRTVEDYYTSSGVEKYFLTDLPTWANFDQRGSCYRSSTLRYFDLNALMKSYSINYSQAVQVQATFNEETALYKGNNLTHVTTLKEDELLFYKVSEKVFSKLIFFDPPTYKRVNLVLLDEILNDTKKEKKLKAFLSSKVMDEGVPLLVSFCLTRAEVEKRYPDLNAKMITAEMFSVFTKTGDKEPRFQIDLSEFFTPTQKIYFYSQNPVSINGEIKGLYKTQNY